MLGTPPTDHLPNGDLDPERPLGAQFRTVGVARYRDAARYVQALPYGRTSDRADYRLVLPEGRGSCSTKHALLAALAAETGLSVELALGIYLMDEANTPGTGDALAAAGLDAVPEAHCFLVSAHRRVDLTWPNRTAELPPVLSEERIRPDQIGAYKTTRHRAYVEAWAAQRGLDAGRVWAIREACIGALGRLPSQ